MDLASELERRLNIRMTKKGETYKDVILNPRKYFLSDEYMKDIENIFRFRETVMGSRMALSPNWVKENILIARKVLAKYDMP